MLWVSVGLGCLYCGSRTVINWFFGVTFSEAARPEPQAEAVPLLPAGPWGVAGFPTRRPDTPARDPRPINRLPRTLPFCALCAPLRGFRLKRLALLREQVHLGSAFRAQRRRATTHLSLTVIIRAEPRSRAEP